MLALVNLILINLLRYPGKYGILILLFWNSALAASEFNEIWNQRIAKEPEEIGIASIYNDRRTASGERFDPRALTCAHKTRPLCTALEAAKGICPARSMILVGLAGKVVQCRVNDRGPFVKGRIVDLSAASAKALGLSWEQGLAKVTVD